MFASTHLPEAAVGDGRLMYLELAIRDVVVQLEHARPLPLQLTILHLLVHVGLEVQLLRGQGEGERGSILYGDLQLPLASG